MENQPPDDHRQFYSAVINRNLAELKTILSRKSSMINQVLLANNGCTALHIAAIEEELQIAKLLLKHGAYVRKKNRNGDTCLHFAAESGNRGLVELFLQGSRVNALNRRKLTPLHVAVRNGRLEIVLILLNNGAQLDTQDVRGNTPLHDAVCKRKDLEIIKLLLSHGADPNLANNERETAFHKSFPLENDDLTDLFLRHGANPRSKDYDGENALHLAARYSGVKIMQKLLQEHKMNSNELDRDGATAMHLLLLYSNKDNDTIMQMVRALVAYRARIDFVDRENQTLIYCAAIQQRLAIVEYLLSLGANIDGYRKCMPVFPAVENGHIEMVEFLIRHGAKLNAKSSNDDSPLHIAINCIVKPGKCFKVVKLLLENGVNVDERDRDGWTALQLAIDRGDSRIVDYLIERGASVVISNNAKQSPLYIAVYNGMLNLVEKLIHLGARVDDRDCDKCSPLSLAVGNDDEDMVQLLLNSGAEANDLSAIFAASRNGRIGMLKMLTSRGAVVEHGRMMGYLVLVEAIKFRKPKMVQYLLDDGADVNCGIYNLLPLYHAVVDYHDENDVSTAANKECAKKIVQVLIKHVAFLLVSNRTVGDVNFEVIKWYEWTDEFFEACQKELINMMDTKVYDFCNTSYFDVMGRTHDSLVHCLRCDEVVAILKSGAYKEMFVNYADALERNYTRGLHRLEMVDEFMDVLNDVLGFLLPYDVICEIVEYFSDDDLKVCLGK